MKNLIILFFTMCAPLGAYAEEKYAEKNLDNFFDEYVEVTNSIGISHFQFNNAKWADIFSHIQRESKMGDPKKEGIELFVPSEFKKQFDELELKTWTAHLSDNLRLSTILGECPPPAPFIYFPLSPRRIAIIPMDAVLTEQPTKPNKTQ